MLSYIRRTRLALKRYQKNREGATAIEFAMLIVPFCMLLFAVLELGIIFFLSASAPPPVEPDNFDTTSARSPVVVRAQYYYRLALPAEFTRLANTRGNTRIIEAVTAFRNEPFPSGCGS